MVGATRRFGAEEQALLEVAHDALTYRAAIAGPIGRMIAGDTRLDDPVLEPLGAVAAAVDRLRRDAGFLESEGAEVRHALPGGTFSHFVPAGAWRLLGIKPCAVGSGRTGGRRAPASGTGLACPVPKRSRARGNRGPARRGCEDGLEWRL